jgi:hypothetical protein
MMTGTRVRICVGGWDAVAGVRTVALLPEQDDEAEGGAERDEVEHYGLESQSD